jgi:hypothetical protein
MATKKIYNAHGRQSKRFYRNDYASGVRSGWCKTRQNAVQAAMKHILEDGYTAATIICMRTDKTIARVSLNRAGTKVIVHSSKIL